MMTEPNQAPRVTPTASMPVRVPWGHWLAQALAHETEIVEKVAGAGVSMALGAVPMGSIVRMFVGPELVKQYVDMGLSALEGLVDPLALTVDDEKTVLGVVANLINKNEPALASLIGEHLEPMIAAVIGKLGVKA